MLASALAEFVSLHAATGEFDFAAIQNLVSKALSLDQGAMDTVYIKNLAVTGANMLSATLGKLVVKGDDGKYYRLFVSADGRISAEETQDVGAEIDGGGQVVETNMNVGSLNAMDLQAGSAVINSILTTALSAGSITAADAMIASATIPALYATTIEAIGNSLQLLTGGSSRVFRGETAPSGAKVGDLWIQPSQGFIHQRAEEVLPEFYLLGSDLYYAGSEYALAMDDSGDLYAQGILPYIPAIAAGGTLTAWMRVKDGELDKAAQDALDSSRENAAVIAEHAAEIALMRGEIALRVTEAVYQETAEGLRQQIERNGSSIELLSDRIGSQVSAGRLDEITGEMEESISRIVQRADSIEATLTEKVDGEELRSYIRYEDGAVEIGSSGSRYAARTSDTGFTVLQDGAVMTSMVKNTVSAPVLEARRQFQLGRFSIRAGNDGGLLIL